jgi:hypothetical protein
MDYLIGALALLAIEGLGVLWLYFITKRSKFEG